MASAESAGETWSLRRKPPSARADRDKTNVMRFIEGRGATLVAIQSNGIWLWSPQSFSVTPYSHVWLMHPWPAVHSSSVPQSCSEACVFVIGWGLQRPPSGIDWHSLVTIPRMVLATPQQTRPTSHSHACKQ